MERAVGIAVSINSESKDRSAVRTADTINRSDMN